MSAITISRRLEQNQLLLALPRSDYERLRPELREVSLPHGTVLFEPRERITHVYFPQECVVSLLTPMHDGPGVEVAIVGKEGMVGVSVFLGTDRSSMQAVSQVADGARRLTVAAFRRALAWGTAFQRIMLRYTGTILDQVAQCAACNQRHRVEQRCARWFLMTQDRVGADHFTLTQEFLGQMLGVQRPTVSVAASRLQATGAIHYSRGRVTVTDRACLEQLTCSCYQIMRDNYARSFA